MKCILFTSKVFYTMRAGVRQVHAGRKPRHVLLSSSVDTVLGDVFADTTSTTSETIAAEQQVLMDPIGRSQHSAGAQRMAQSAARSGLLATWHVHLAQDICLLVSLKVHSTVFCERMLHCASSGTTGVIADLHMSVSRCRELHNMFLVCVSTLNSYADGCRLVLRPEQIALALAEQPSAQPLVSCDILQSPLTSPTEGHPHSQPHRAADLSTDHLPVGHGTHRAPTADLQSLGQPQQPSLYSPEAALSPMQHARASVQQWGRPKTAVAATPSPRPSPDSMVICGPTWSFPVEASSPAPLRRGSIDAAHLQHPGCVRLQTQTAREVAPQSQAGGAGARFRPPDPALQPEERSLSFRCRQISSTTASLPDMAALLAALRGEPRPGQVGGQRAESRLLPDLAVTERAQTLEAMQAAAEQLSARCASDAQPCDEAGQSAAWPLKKGAWDRIQHTAKAVKPDKWRVNEAAGLAASVKDLKEAMTIQPKSFDQAADAVVATMRKEMAEISPKATSQPAAGDSQFEEETAPAATAADAPLKGARAEKSVRAVRSAMGSGQPRSTADAASAVDKAPGRPHSVAQKLLAKANCFAALAASPLKGDARLQVQHAASQSASASPAGKAAAVPAQAQLFSTSTRDAATPGRNTDKAASVAEASRPASAMQAKELLNSKEMQQSIVLPQSSPVPKEAARKQLLADPVLTEEAVAALTPPKPQHAGPASVGRRSPGRMSPSAVAMPGSPIQESLASLDKAQMAPPGRKSMTLSKGPSGAPEAPSYDIHVACQSSTMAVALGSHAAGDAGPQQPQKTSSSKTLPMAAPQPAWPGQKLSPSQESLSTLPGMAWPGQSLSGSPPSKSTIAKEQLCTASSRPGRSDEPVAKGLQASAERRSTGDTTKADPVQVYSASLGSTRNTAQAALEKLDGLPGSPKSAPDDDACQAVTSSVAAKGDKSCCVKEAGSQKAAAGGQALLEDESRSVSDIVFSSDGEDEETLGTSCAAGQSTAGDSGWGGSSLFTTEELPDHSEATESQCSALVTSGEMFTAETEVVLSEDAELGLQGSGDASMAAQVELTISQSTEVLMQTASDCSLKEETTDAELAVIAAQVIPGSASSVTQAGFAAADEELHSMVAQALGSTLGMPSAQGACDAQKAAPIASTAEGLHTAQLAAQCSPAKESAQADSKSAFHLPDNLFESPLAAVCTTLTAHSATL